MARADRSKVATVIGALGIVFGDIGTSPIYTFRECLKAAGQGAAPDAVMGLLSLIVWTLTIVVTAKYVVFVMRADNAGEGGIVALLDLACTREPDKRLAAILLMAGIAGAALFFGDGMITPAISVLSAIEGLNVATPVFQPYVVPIVVAILVALFLVQSRGSARIGKLFGPVMAIWFAAIGLAGLAHVLRNPAVLLALDPRHAIGFLASHGGTSLAVLGSAFLAVTGAEALYADMGHFGRGPIRISWFAIVFPALVLNYFGQGASVMSTGAADNPFYRMFPGWSLYPVVLLATAATVIASQAVISGAFSLAQQAMQTVLLPRLDVFQTSTEQRGQVYVPTINWILMIGVIGLVLGFRSSDALASAYGIAVSGTMVTTTLLLGVVAHRTWRWGLVKTALIVGAFGIVDLAFFFANALKIFDGGWFPLLIGLIVFTLMSTWHAGRRLILERTDEETVAIDAFLNDVAPALPRVKGTAVFLAAPRDTIPFALVDNIRHNKVLHEHVALLTVLTERQPFIGAERRMEVHNIGLDMSRIILHFGFAERPDVPAALAANKDRYPIDLDNTSFFVGRERAVASMRPGLAAWREKLFALMTRNAVGATDYFRIPAKRVIELGTQVEV